MQLHTAILFCMCIHQYTISFYPANGKIPVTVIIREPVKDTQIALILLFWRSLSYIVEDVEPEEKLSRAEERAVHKFLIDFQNNGYTIKSVVLCPLILNLECFSTAALNKLVKENTSGNLAKQLEDCFSTFLKKKMGISMILLETKITDDEYKLCRRKLAKEGRQ